MNKRSPNTKSGRDFRHRTVTSLISAWISHNFLPLVDQVKQSHFRGKLQTDAYLVGPGGKTLDLVREVLENEYVHRFPCLYNVERCTKKILKKQLKKLSQRSDKPQKIYIKIKRWTHKLSCTIPLERNTKGAESVGTPSRTLPHLVGNPKLDTFIDVNVQLADAIAYWKLINRASAYDREPNAFDRTLRRASKRWNRKTLTNKNATTAATKVATGTTTLEKRSLISSVSTEPSAPPTNSGSSATSADDFHSRVGDVIPDLVPLASISKTVQRIVQVRDSTHEHRVRQMPFVVLNDNIEPFWNSKFLFHLRNEYTGVALDTVTGTFYNADFQRRHEQWECRLSAITIRRWKHFVRGEGGGIRWGEFRKLSRGMWMRQRVGKNRDEGKLSESG